MGSLVCPFSRDTNPTPISTQSIFPPTSPHFPSHSSFSTPSPSTFPHLQYIPHKHTSTSKSFHSGKRLRKLKFDIAVLKAKILTKSFSLSSNDTVPMSDNVTFYTTLRKMPKNTPISTFFSLPPPKNFHFYIQHLKNLKHFPNAKFLFLQVTYDYLQFSVCTDFHLSNACRYFYRCEFHNQQYILIYKLVHHIPQFTIELTNIQIVLVGQLLCNFKRTSDAPFCPSPQTHIFTDSTDSYHNKYQTHASTLESIKALDPTLPDNFTFEDYMPIGFNFEEHPHLFLRAILKIGYHNPKYGEATNDSPYAGLFLAIYVIFQFLLTQIRQFILISEKIAKIIHSIKILPKNSAIVKFSPNLGFIRNKRSLKSAPGGQQLLCLGYKPTTLQATVHSNYSFNTSSKLTPLKLPTAFPNLTTFSTILSKMRTFEKLITSTQLTPTPSIDISNPDFKSCFQLPTPDPNRKWHLLKRYHYELDPALINGHTISFPNVSNHHVLHQHDTYKIRPEFNKQRDQWQEGTRCSECGKNHPRFCCEIYHPNYKITHPYPKALWDTYNHLPRQTPIHLPEMSEAGFEQLTQKYKQKIKHFWTTFNRLHPHFKNYKFQETVFLDQYSRAPLLWAIGVPQWHFKQNLVGIILPFLRTPIAMYIKSSFDPSSEEQQFMYQFILEKVPAKVIAPWPKKKARVISQAFVIGLDKTDTQTRPRLVVEFPWLNKHLPYTSFQLPTALTTLNVVQTGKFKCLNLDLN